MKIWIRSNRWSWCAALVVLGSLAFGVAAAISWYCPFVPRIHDEFSYLLAADTLLHGRLANPAPNFWQPFQSFHILVEPAYASKYPLGQGAIVALGWALFGQPIAGCWIAAGLCAASMAWMLGGVTSRRWAIWGGLLVAVHPAMQVTWSQSLMSGWLTAAGCGLLTGGVLRLRRRAEFWAALMAGVGVALLALTRPFEGLVATLLIAGVMCGFLRRFSLRERLKRLTVIVPVAACPVLLALVLTVGQNLATTGRALEMPYQIHEKKYGVAPLFVFGQPKLPDMEVTDELPEMILNYHHGWSLNSFQQRAGLRGWLWGIVLACQTVLGYWVVLAFVPLLSIAQWRSFCAARYLAVAIGVQLLISSSVCWIFPHYLSPILPWLLLLTVLGSRRIFRLFRSGAVFGGLHSQFLAYAILSMQFLLLLLAAKNLPADPQRDWAIHRAQIEAELSSQAGAHLVLVAYSSEHNVHQEWVYNGAELTSAKIIWARDEREGWNRRLLAEYGTNRKVWRLHADQIPVQLEEYTSPESEFLGALSRSTASSDQSD